MRSQLPPTRALSTEEGGLHRLPRGLHLSITLFIVRETHAIIYAISCARDLLPAPIIAPPFYQLCTRQEAPPLAAHGGYFPSSPLMHRAGADIGPAWSPDARRIAFSSDGDGDHEICLMNADGTGLVRLTDNLVHDVDPSWSPDGRYLSFTNDPPQNADIYIISADGLLLLSLTDHPATDFGGSWAR